MIMRIAVIFMSLVGTSTAADTVPIFFSPIAVLSGVAHARDGDDIEFRPDPPIPRAGIFSVRLRGIVAPEDRRGAVEPGGPASTEHLAQIVDGKTVNCYLDGTTAGSGGRPAGICYVDGVDVGFLQVRSGHARDCPAFSGGQYQNAEAAARAEGNNLSAIYPLPAYC